MRPNSQETADLITFTEKILNGKLHFLCSENSVSQLLLLTASSINDLHYNSWLELVFLRSEIRERLGCGKIMVTKNKSVTGNSGQTFNFSSLIIKHYSFQQFQNKSE